VTVTADLHAAIVDEIAHFDGPVDRALRAVVELHAPHDRLMGGPIVCGHCNGTHGEDDPWPCSTIQAIARELGVDHA
jgi:hypothetical protein